MVDTEKEVPQSSSVILATFLIEIPFMTISIKVAINAFSLL